MIDYIYLPNRSLLRYTDEQQDINMVYHTCRTALLLVSLLFGVLPWQAVQAQATDEPPLTIQRVETDQFPTIALTLDGADWPAERAATSLQVFVNDEAQTITGDSLVQQGISFVLAIDPNNLFATGQSGQTHYVEMAGVLLDLIDDQSLLLRNRDWMAAYLLSPEGAELVQEWTQEPNLVYNSVVQKRPAEVTDAPLATSALINGIQQFTGSPAASPQPRSLLLFSAGSDALDVAAVVATAQEMAVQVYVVELAAGADQTAAVPATQESALFQIAQQTGGGYVVMEQPETLMPLWERLRADHTLRSLTFQSSVAAPKTLMVNLPVAGGAALSATAEPAAFAELPADVAAVPAAVQNVLTSAEGTLALGANSANSLPVTESSQVAAATQPPANDISAPPAAELGVETSTSPGAIMIPGLGVALPRGVLQLSLPVLLILIAYFVYAEVRDRRRKRNRTYGGASSGRADPFFTLDDNSEPLSANQFQLRTQDASTPHDVAPAAPLAKPAPSSMPAPMRSPVRPPARPASFDEDEDNDEMTVRPPRMEDNEATYRVQEVEQPILGYLVRATSDPNLPKELPIYGLNPAPGEVRQIHVGRHSKNNTVVINDKSISREHAVIIQRDGRLYLRDNASTSGTFLNWKRLNPGEELLLRHNDLISFGQIVYEFRLHGEDEVTIAEA